MPALKAMTDNQFDLAIVDPEYGENMSKKTAYRANGFQKYKKKDWDIKACDDEYFSLLFKVSVNQIVWGANYYPHVFKPSNSWIVWDKKQPEGITFSMFELAYNSLKGQAKIYRQSAASNSNKATNKYAAKKSERFHQTQKPVALYKWLLKNYAKPGDKILDTHGGSMSIAIACYDMGFDLTCFELDKDYYKYAVERFRKHIAQKDAFIENQIDTYGRQMEI